MTNLEDPTEVVNLDTLEKFLETKQERPVHNTFLELHEPERLDSEDYKAMQYTKYAYAVKEVDDSF